MQEQLEISQTKNNALTDLLNQLTDRVAILESKSSSSSPPQANRRVHKSNDEITDDDATATDTIASQLGPPRGSFPTSHMTELQSSTVSALGDSMDANVKSTNTVSVHTRSSFHFILVRVVVEFIHLFYCLTFRTH